MKEFLKREYQFSNYQIAQLEFFFKTVFSEISKILLIGILFRRELAVYCIGLVVLLILRTSTGGLHCKTYFGCLFSSAILIITSFKLLPFIPLGFIPRMVLLVCCIAVIYLVGPVTSDVHMPLTDEVVKRGRLTAVVFVSCVTVLMGIIPGNSYMNIIFWIIITHTLQLVAAKVRKKRKEGK